MLLDAYIFHYLEKPKTPINKHDELKSPIGGRAQPICIFTSSHGPVTIFNDPISPEEFFLVPEKAKKEQRKRKTTNQVALPQKKITSGKEAHEQDNNDIHKHDEELRQRSKGRVKQERKVRDKPKETNRAKKKDLPTWTAQFLPWIFFAKINKLVLKRKRKNLRLQMKTNKKK
jgi:hypothetical protein